MDTLNDLLSGKILPIYLTVLSVFFFFYLRGRPFRGLCTLLRGLKECDSGGTSPKKAVMMALAGTLGVGNIVGVADALQKGGPGVLFWMILSAFAAMTVKYAEVVLSMLHRRYLRRGAVGGPMFYLPKPAAVAFCLLCLLCAFSVGSVMQTSACCRAAMECFREHSAFLFKGSINFPSLSLFLSLLMAGGLALCIFTAKKGLFDLSVKLVPAMSILYTLLCFGVIAANLKELPRVFHDILSGAFGLDCAARGVSQGLLVALRFGVIRGLLSNEAGCGTAPIAHAASGARSGASQGALGVVEVAVDTLFLCTLTGVTLLCSRVSLSTSQTPVKTILDAFSSVFGRLSEYLLLLALICFAFATLVCWSFYAESCLRFLFKKSRFVLFGKIVFCLFAATGILVPETLLWQLSDFSVAAMTLMNCTALFFYRRDIREDTENFFNTRQKSEKKKFL